jgi:hypothetical protein
MCLILKKILKSISDSKEMTANKIHVMEEIERIYGYIS